jgi:AcrR family transcriptional regulator
MSVLHQDTGRFLQKRRTRLAIVKAASELMANGRQPTVAEAADAALVSRATAYRYFQSQRALLLEVAMDAIHPEIGPALAAAPPHDALARFDAVCSTLFDLVVGNEAQMRTMLRVTQEEWLEHHNTEPALRQGRRLEWIEQALAPLTATLDSAALKRLVNAIATVVGIEPYVVLRDVCGLDREAALATMRWAGRTLIASAARGA